MFVQYLADQTLAVVRGERRPRRNIQYRDLAHAIARVDNLEFLVDVAPRLVTVKEARRLHAPFAEHDARWAEADREQARVVDEAEQLSKQDQQAMDGTSTYVLELRVQMAVWLIENTRLDGEILPDAPEMTKFDGGQFFTTLPIRSKHSLQLG